MTPAGHARRLGSWEGPLEAVLDGFAAGRRDFGIACQLVLDIARGVPLERAQPTVDLASRYADRGVVGLGLGGSESARPAEAFESFFAQAVRCGLPSVPHAGEACGPESVWEAVTVLQAERIGHGIRSVEDEALLERLRDLGIVLEVCLTSNVFTKAVSSVADHPLPRLIDAGVLVTLNSDDPAMFASPISREYAVARSAFDFSDDELAGLAAAGIRGSFAPSTMKNRLLSELDAWLIG